MKRKKILVYWDYKRQDQLVPFEKLKTDFEWQFIFFRTHKEDEVDLEFPCFYWGHYKTPYQLLSQLKPDAIIFSNLSNVYAIALNVACRNKKVKTFLLDHGIKLHYDYYLEFEANRKASNQNIDLPVHPQKQIKLSKFHTLFFYLSSFKISNGMQFCKAAQLLFSVFSLKSDNAFARIKFDLRNPEHYILFSKQNFIFYHQRDGIAEERVSYIGNPSLDGYIRRLNQVVTESKEAYYLLLDEGQIDGFGISMDQKNEFINKLNQFCLKKGAKLIVKKHPFDYHLNGFHEHPNIIYYESADIDSLIVNARGCFAISTTLMLPLIVNGKVVAFRLEKSRIQKTLSEFGVRFLDFFSFMPGDIDFDHFKLDNTQALKFEKQFLYKMDGRSLDRLKDLLQD